MPTTDRQESSAAQDRSWEDDFRGHIDKFSCSAPGQAPSSPDGWRPASETETAGGSSSAARSRRGS